MFAASIYPSVTRGGTALDASADGAVFLSYASQDVAAARRICAALRASGIEVWFDQDNLNSGDPWDASIRRQIRGCALFVPVVSARTQARDEGYFRREWRLAADRSHDLADAESFLLPVTIDDVAPGEARVPAAFFGARWTHLPEGEVPEAFVRRVRKLLAPGVAETLARSLALLWTTLATSIVLALGAH
jgi:hypothetical protein